MESLTTGPELENNQGHHVRFGRLGSITFSPGLDAGAFFDAIVQTGNKTCRD